MASLTVRNVPEDAKHRFRQVAARHGRSMEEHLRQLVIDAGAEPSAAGFAEAQVAFRHAPPAAAAESVAATVADGGRYADIRLLPAKAAMAELRRLANGVGLDLPPRLNTELEAPQF